MASPQSVRGYGNGSLDPARPAAHRARRFRPATSRDACVAVHTAASRTRPSGSPPGTTTPRKRLPTAARYRPPPISAIASNQFLLFQLSRLWSLVISQVNGSLYCGALRVPVGGEL